MRLTYLIALCLTTALAAPVGAQPQDGKAKDQHGAEIKHGHGMKGKHHGMHHNKVQADWVKALGLEGDKAEKVRAIQQSYDEERQQLHTQHMQAMRDLKSDREEQLQEVLSQEELLTLQRMWESHSGPKAKMGYHHD